MSRGLIGLQILKSPKDFLFASSNAIKNGTRIIQRITDKKGDVIKDTDVLSDIICNIIDTAELIRHVHPERKWVESANCAYQQLGSFINHLNTNVQLYQSLKEVMERDQFTLSEEKRTVGSLFLADYVKSGVNMPLEKRSRFVALTDQINEIGHAFTQETTPNLRVKLLEEMLQLRSNIAKLLGFPSYAHLYLNDKWAKSPENVMKFLESEMNHNKPLALQQMELLRKSFKNISNISDKERIQYAHVKLGIQPNPSLKEYFSINKVIHGISDLFSLFYGVSFQIAEVNSGEIWHKDVTKLNILDDQKQKIGILYLDLFDRDKNISSAAQFTVRCSRRIDNDPPNAFTKEHYDDLYQMGISKSSKGIYQLPIIALSCNFSKHNEFLSWPEVETLFHEMGHAIHSVSSRTEFQHVAGTRCSTDFVEVSSILMELLARHPAIVQLYARHYKTGEPISYQDFQNYIAPHDISCKIDRQQQIFYAILDQVYHSGIQESTTKILERVQNQVHVIPYSGRQLQSSFSHLFGYGSGYYSYLWSRRVSKSIYSQFFEPVLNQYLSSNNNMQKIKHEIRRRGVLFRDEILSFGGSRDPSLMKWHLFS